MIKKVPKYLLYSYSGVYLDQEDVHYENPLYYEMLVVPLLGLGLSNKNKSPYLSFAHSLCALVPQFQSTPLLRICLVVLVSYLTIALLLFGGGFLFALCSEPSIKNLPVFFFWTSSYPYKIVSWRFFFVLVFIRFRLQHLMPEWQKKGSGGFFSYLQNI